MTSKSIARLLLCIGLVTWLPARGEDKKAAPTRIDLSQYQIAFDDEFDRLDVSAYGPGTRWIAHTPWYGDFGDAEFANPQPDFPFTVKEGVLRIEARKDGGGKWHSGLLSSTDPSGAGFSQQYGYFEIRAKLPPGSGLWPGFWLIGNKAPGGSAEVDILEYLGHDPEKYEATVHVWPRDGIGEYYEAKNVVKVAPGSLVEEFHTYGAAINPDWIVFYMDREEMARTPTPPQHKQPLFILISLALGSGWPIDKTPNPSWMDVDYVRAYARK
jgi:beta-glucanase (GH16 family)